MSLRRAAGSERSPRPLDDYRPLAAALMARASRLAEAFRNVVFAQVALAPNTALTAIYLALVLPLAGISLPLTKTLIAVTFIAGLLPVIGNLISNTVIVVVSLAHSPQVAAASLAFLVVIHKLEYFVNARIVGAHINARAWELLSAMLVMEAAFGLGSTDCRADLLRLPQERTRAAGNGVKHVARRAQFNLGLSRLGGGCGGFCHAVRGIWGRLLFLGLLRRLSDRVRCFAWRRVAGVLDLGVFYFSIPASGERPAGRPHRPTACCTRGDHLPICWAVGRELQQPPCSST